MNLYKKYFILVRMQILFDYICINDIKHCLKMHINGINYCFC